MREAISCSISCFNACTSLTPPSKPSNPPFPAFFNFLTRSSYWVSWAFPGNVLSRDSHASCSRCISPFSASINRSVSRSSFSKISFTSGTSRAGRATENIPGSSSGDTSETGLTAPDVILGVSNRTPSTVISSTMTFLRSRFNPSRLIVTLAASTAFVIGVLGFVTCSLVKESPVGNKLRSAASTSTLAPTALVPAASIAPFTQPSTKNIHTQPTMAANTTNAPSPHHRIHFVISPASMTKGFHRSDTTYWL